MRLSKGIGKRKARRMFYSDKRLTVELVSYLYEYPSEDFVEYKIREIPIPASSYDSLQEISEQVRNLGAELLYRPRKSNGAMLICNLQIVGNVWTVLWYLNQLIELESELG